MSSAPPTKALACEVLMVTQKAAKTPKAEKAEGAQAAERRKAWHEGKKTYASLAGVLASLAV